MQAAPNRGDSSKMLRNKWEKQKYSYIFNVLEITEVSFSFKFPHTEKLHLNERSKMFGKAISR